MAVGARAQSAPPDYETDLPTSTFGDANAVGLLAAVLAEKDDRAREQATMNLGQTHNALALPYLEKSAADSSALVRAAAMQAAGQFPAQQAAKIIRPGLADADTDVIFAALRTVRQLQAKQCQPQLVSLLNHKNADVQAAALHTLTQLSLAVDAAQLKTLMAHPQAAVRLRAAQNALCLDPNADIVEPLLQLATKDTSIIRCAALAALGKHGFAPVSPLLASLARDTDPLLRLGTLRAYVQAREGDQVKNFLADTSEMVVEEALAAAGKLKAADCASDLFEQMLQAPMGEQDSLDRHKIARQSLEAIANSEVAGIAGGKLRLLIGEWHPRQGALNKLALERSRLQDAGMADNLARLGEIRNEIARIRAGMDRTARNINSCCHILGVLKSQAAFEDQLELLPLLPTDSPILGSIAWSLGRSGNPKAVGPLVDSLAMSSRDLQQFLQTRMMMPPPYIPYDDAAVGQIVAALGNLDPAVAAPKIHEIIAIGKGRPAVKAPICEGVKVLSANSTPGQREALDKLLTALVADDEAQSSIVCYRTMKLCGRMKIAQALPALQKHLAPSRYDRATMQAAAWAIGEITGKTPAIGDPALNLGTDWIVKPYVE